MNKLPEQVDINNLLYDLNVFACVLFKIGDDIRLEEYSTTEKEAIEYYTLKHEIKNKIIKLRFKLEAKNKAIFQPNDDYELYLYPNSAICIPADDDMEDFLEKEKTIINLFNKEFPGWLEKQFRSPIIQRLFLRVKA